MRKMFASIALLITHAVANGAEGSFPERPIKMIIPVSAGSTIDITARIVAKKMSDQIGQPVVIENRPGADGAIGLQVAARSKPDGYTLVVANSSSMVVGPAIIKNLGVDPPRDFTPISLISYTPILLTVSGASTINTVSDLVKNAKNRPSETLSYGNTAPTYRLVMELLKVRSGVDLVSVGYKGPAEATTDLLGGRITLLPNSLGAATPYLKNGQMKAIAVLGDRRIAALPSVPTMIESGYKDFEFVGWTGVLAPAGTPVAIVEFLNREIVKALASPEVHELFSSLFLEPAPTTAQQFADKIKIESVRFQTIAADAGLAKE